MRTYANRILNLLLWLTLCFLAGTGFLLAFRLLPGSRGGSGLQALGMERHDWRDLHTWSSYAILALLMVHLWMHWQWIWKVASQRRFWLLGSGFGAGVFILIWLTFLPVSERAGERDGRGHHGRHDRISVESALP
jgi:hypothetical protein